jgi:hypothetical protein
MAQKKGIFVGHKSDCARSILAEHTERHVCSARSHTLVFCRVCVRGF